MYFNRDQITKERYKMYRVGKKWVTGSLVVVGVVVGLNAGQPATGLAATGSDPQEETPGGLPAEPTQKQIVTADEPTQEQTVTADEPADVTETPASASPATTPAKSQLADTYDTAQQQVDEANGQSQVVNDSQAKLQALLDQVDLTAQEDWQATLQAALDDYQKNASDFNESATKAQALIAAYQDQINDTTKDQPNAVQDVTNPDGKTLADYQQAVNDFNTSVDEQVTAVQADLANYVVSVQVNQSSIDLTQAAEALNAALKRPTGSSENLSQLKATYDQAVAAYNTAVVVYNDKMGTALATIQAVNLPDLTQLLADRQVQVAYELALAKFQAVQGDVTAYQAAIAKWQSAVDAYNTTLTTLTEMGDLTADDTVLQTAQVAVEAAVEKIAVTRAAYADFMENPENQAAIAAYLAVEETYPNEFATYQAAKESYHYWQVSLASALARLAGAQAAGAPTTAAEAKVQAAQAEIEAELQNMADAQAVISVVTQPTNATYQAFLEQKQAVVQPVDQALADFQAALTSWQQAYQTQREAIASMAPDFPVFKVVEAAVRDAQSEVTEALATLTETQAGYQEVLAAYQAALAQSGRETDAVTGSLVDLAELQTELIAATAQNEQVMTTVPDYLAVRQAAAQLQQRVGQLNQIIAAINADQEMLQTLYTTADLGDVWTILTPYFQSVGDDLATRAAEYQLAVVGGDQGLSFDDLVDHLKNAQAAYGAEEDTIYPAVTDQYQKFATDFITFQAAYQELLAKLVKSAPDTAANAVAADSMKNGDNLSTDGVPTNTKVVEEGGSTINVYQYVGNDLDYFVGRGLGGSELNLQGDRYGSAQHVLIEEKDKIRASSASGTEYEQVSPDGLAKLTATLEGMVQPFVVKEGVTYHLAGIRVKGAGNDEIPTSEIIRTRGEIYTFTSLDALGEFMAMFTGVTSNTNINHLFEFFYTASPTADDEFSVEEMLPRLETLGITATTSAWQTGELTADAVVPQALAPNAVSLTVTGEYPVGEAVDIAFTKLTSVLAPMITLNHVQAIPTEPTGNPDLPDEQNPEVDKQLLPAGDGEGVVTVSSNPKTTESTPGPGQVTPQREKISHPTALTADEAGAPDLLSLGIAVGDDLADGGRATRVTTRGHEPSKSASRQAFLSQAALPQTDEQSPGIMGVIGSLLLALSGLTSFKILRRKR